MRILIVEDDPKIASFLGKGLREAGFLVETVSDGEDGLHRVLTERFDACIVDIMLPKLDGLSLVKQMRQEGNTTPVLMLSARHSVEDRIKGLQTGGDDYLIKPFAFSELLARVHALIRRANTSVSSPSSLTVGDLTMNLLTREVFRGERRIDLQPREFSLLEYLMRNAGQVMSKTMILEHVWEYSFDPQTNVVDVLVCRLRAKIDRGFEQQMISTIRGVGYVLQSGP